LDQKVLFIARLTKVWKGLIKRLLEQGIACEQIDTSRIAYKRIDDDYTIDLVVVDTHTAEEGGRTLAGRLKGSSRFVDIPILVAGEDLDRKLVADLAGMGVRDFMILPTEPEQFEEKVRDLIANGKKTVLIVDDEPAIAEILKDHLELERYRVVTAGSAEEAVEVLAKTPVHVIVSDVVLPGEWGPQLLSRVKKDHPDVGFIIMTGFSGKFKPQDALDAGADGYFTKPFKNTELVRTLREVLKGRTRANKTQQSASA